MIPSLLSATVLCSLVSLAAASDFSTQSLPLYHRLVSFSPSSEAAAAPEWIFRGLVHVDTIQDEAWLEETGKGVEELVSPRYLAGGDEQLQEEKYQIAIGESEDSKRQTIVLDSCILLHPASSSFIEHITLMYNSPPAAPQIIGFRYTTSGKGSRAGCVKDAGSEQLERGNGALGGEITVKVDRGTPPEPVHFRDPEAVAGGKPVVVGEDGKIIPPPPEKSFIQKNWPYLLPIVVILMISGGGEEPAAGAK